MASMWHRATHTKLYIQTFLPIRKGDIRVDKYGDVMLKE